MEYVCAFQDLGKDVTVDQGTMSNLQKFVCHLYGQENEIDVDNARHNLFRMGNCTEETLPPTSDSLVQHMYRAFARELCQATMFGANDNCRKSRWSWLVYRERGVVHQVDDSSCGTG